jgi:hypothetical protein
MTCGPAPAKFRDRPRTPIGVLMTIKDRFERFTRRIKPTEEHFKKANRQTKWSVSQLTVGLPNVRGQLW